MNAEAKEFYQEENLAYSIKNDTLNLKIKNYSRLRIFWFLFGIAAIYVATSFSLVYVSIVGVLFLVVFIFIVIQHAKLISQQHEVNIALKLFKQELQALDEDYSAFYPANELIDNHHEFAFDLDLFGNSSVFQMINRAFSKAGIIFLADLLKKLENNVDTILDRQNAINELSNNQNWLIRFRILGILAFSKENSFSADPNELADNLPQWIKRQSIFGNFWFKFAQIFIPLCSFAVFGLFISGLISSSFFVLYLFITLGFTGFFSKKINAQHQELSRQSETLFRFQNLIKHIESAQFKSLGFKKIQNELLCKDGNVSMGLKSLGKIIQAFDTRLNLFAWLILNYFLLWDILQCRRLEKWKNTYKQLPEKAFGSISEMEMLLGFSTFKFNRSDLIFPEIETKKFWIEGKSVGHPLMHTKSRVDNDILFSSPAQFSVITGANMAGKSTYLRTVGVNLVLALCGGPVCAKYFKTSILKPFTSIKTSDSLSNNESYFYAELLRLQRIIKALNTGDSYFIILDEILKGTNSKDKEQGSKALVQRLISLNATGIIATHDLQLAELKTNFPQNIENECFEVEIENEKLVFDYKLRRGISKNLNATFLMKTMGIS